MTFLFWQMSFGQQILKFIELHKKWSDKERAEAIYMVNIGADDYLNFAKAHPNANPVEQVAFVARVLQKLSRDLMVCRFLKKLLERFRSGPVRSTLNREMYL